MPIVQYTEQAVIPMGVYNARITEVNEDTEGQFGPQFQYNFEITAGEHEGVNLLGWSSQKFSKKSKMRKWATAALQRTFSPGEQIDTDDLVGKPVRIEVLKKTSESDGSEFNKIDDVTAPSVAQKEAAQSLDATAHSVEDEPQQEVPLMF